MDLAEALGLGERELVAFVGAGGKKTAMAALVGTARERGLSVGYTTTTHTPPPGDLPLVLAGEESLAPALSEAGDAVVFAAERVDDPARADEKVRGYDPAAVSALFERDPFDWLVVKADGARRREFKAPGEHEPAVPAAATTVVPVASVRAVDRPLDSRVVHRPERVAALVGTEPGATIAPETVGTVLASESGGLKNAPAEASVRPLLNKADTPELRAAARGALRAAFEQSDRIERGLVTSFETDYCEVLEPDREDA